MASYIKTSDLNERVTFLVKERIKDSYGQVVETNKELATIWACIREQLHKDKLATVGTVLEGTLSIIVRYHQDFVIDTNQRIRWQGLEFEIVDVQKGIYKKDFTTLTVKQV